MSDFHERISPADAEHIWQTAAELGFLTETTRSLLVHDLGRMRSRIAQLYAAFPKGTLHALAIKANPLVEVLREAVKAGAGLEAASIEEVSLAVAADCPPERIVFDSPAKTLNEIRDALGWGVVLNADNFAELDRIEQILQTSSTKSKIGLRINPEVGSGTISHTSVGQAGSKFGVSISANREEIVAAFLRSPWLTGLHVHVGSQGCSLDLLTEAAARVNGLRQEIEFTTGLSLEFLDIGGGLPAVYHQNQSAKSPREYGQRLKRDVPELFSESRQLITEFGRSIQAGCGIAFSRVETIRPQQRMAVIHLGADFLLRPVYRPEDWSHEFFVLDAEGRLKTGPMVPVTITGPLCFSGDIIAREVLLPEIEEGDWIAIRDTGAYTLSLWSRHCNRGIPAVVGYDPAASVPMRILRPAETPADVVRFWSTPAVPEISSDLPTMAATFQRG